MTNKKLLLTCVISFLLFSITLIYTVNYHINKPIKAATKHHTTQKVKLESYDYTITKMDSKGAYGLNKDKTGVYLTMDQIQQLRLNKGDSIRVWFPINNYEQIERIEKLKGGSQNE